MLHSLQFSSQFSHMFLFITINYPAVFGNSVDPDQLASSDLDLHCCKKRPFPILAGQGVIEPCQDIFNNVVCATSKGSDQPAHMRRLLRAFASHLNIVWLLSY